MTISAGLTRYTNNAQTTINMGGNLGAGATSMTVTSALAFPNPGPFRVLVENEIIQVTAGYGTTTWTILRGREGTVDVLHNNGVSVTQMISALELNSMRQEFNVLAFGAIGDNTADDSTAFQNAENDAHALAGGGVIFLPSLAYKIVSSLTTYSNVVFVTYGATFSGAGAASVTPLIKWGLTGTLTIPGALTVQSGGAAVTGAITSTSTITGTALIPSGLTGATQASRYVGSTTTGAPVSGTFAKGDFVITQDGFIYVCTTAGTPGTWQQPAPSLSYGTNIQPLGTLSGGADAAVARDDHIHPTTNVALLNAANVFSLNNTFNGGITGTILTASQGNITSVGTLTSLTMGGTLAVGSNAITKTRNASDNVPVINAKTPDTAFTGVQIWIGPTDPGVSANNGDLWIAG